jgi:hypothetical protein
MSYPRTSIGIAILAMAAGAAFAADAGPWNLQPDVYPGTLCTQPAPASPVAAAFDPYRINPKLAIHAQLKDNDTVVVPTRPSKYVLTLHGFNKGWELWDLKRGAAEKTSRSEVSMREFALSPDGQYLAGFVDNATGKAIEVLSLRTGKAAMHVGVDRNASATPLGFVGQQGLLVQLRDDKTRVAVYDIPTGKVQATIPFEKSFSPDQAALSPNGRYLAIATDKLAIYDTATGQLCAAAPIRGADDKPIFASKTGVVFSPDGKEIAAAEQSDDKMRLVIYDLASGKVLASKTSDYKTRAEDRLQRVQYSPDGALLLVGCRTIVDRASLAPVVDLPERDDVRYARWADPDNVVQIYSADFHLNILGVHVDRNKLAMAIDAVKSGGKAEDIAMAPLTSLDFSAAKTVSFDHALAVPWNVKVPDSAAATKHLVPELNIRPPADIPPGARSEDIPSAFLFTSRETNAVFVEHVVHAQNGRSESNPFDRAKGWIERYDLSFGTVSAEVETPALLQVLDASSTGKSLVFRGGSTGDRVEVWSENNRTFKPVLAFRCVSNVADLSKREKPASVHWAALVDDAHVLVENAEHEIMLVEVPAGKVLWQGRLTSDWGSNDLNSKDHMPVLSPDRKLAAFQIANGLVLIDPLTGAVLSSLPASTEKVNVNAIGFSSDGKQLAAEMQVGSLPMLRTFDLASGTMTADIPLPPLFRWSKSIPQFVDSGYVQVNTELISLAKKAVVWHYMAPMALDDSVHVGAVLPYDRFFYICPGRSRLPAALANVELPDKQARAATDALDPDQLYVWHPGMKVSLSLSVVGDDKFRKQELAKWTAALKEHGIEVADNAPNQLRVNNTILNGENTIYTANRTGEKISVRNQSPGYDITLVAEGKEIWKASYTTPPSNRPAFGFGMNTITIVHKPGESMQQAYDRDHPPMATASTILPPPLYVLRERKIETTQLDRKGVVGETGLAHHPGTPAHPVFPHRRGN